MIIWVEELGLLGRNIFFQMHGSHLVMDFLGVPDPCPNSFSETELHDLPALPCWEKKQHLKGRYS